MTKNKFISLLLSIIMLISLLPLHISAESTDKTERRVYLHGFDDARLLTDTTDTREIKKGDTANIYLAVDDPNKADDDSQWEQQYNLGGFTAKIYYDTKYFELADKNSNTPIEYKFVTEWTDSSVEGEFGEEELPDDFSKEIGYMTVAHGTHTNDGLSDQRIGYAYATIFYKGGKLPEYTKNAGNWYNILKLPLKPIETGRTSVYIDISPDDEYTLELFAKNVPNSDIDDDGIDDIERNFDYTAENGGVFHFNIVDEGKPRSPIADPPSSEYTETQFVRLITDEPGTIYYKTASMSDFDIYTEADHTNGIEIAYTQNIECYVIRDKDGAQSNIETYRYIILPPAPKLFIENEFLPTTYSKYWSSSASGYSVYATDKVNTLVPDTQFPISDGNTIYYTFSPNLSADLITDKADNPFVGKNAEIAWREITSKTGLIPDLIDQKRTIRLVTVNSWGHGDVSTYYLGVKPGEVTAIPDSGKFEDDTLTVALKCTEPETAEIYYTRNDGDPRVNGTLYEGDLSLTYDTTIRAVAKYNGEWGEPTAFWYQFDRDIIAFYPPGEYEGSVNVSLMPKIDGQEIEYSINDGEWTDYTGTIPVDTHTEIKAKIKGTSGEGTLLVYDVRPLAPIFAPESTQLTNPEWISIYVPESTEKNTGHYSIKFTTDGSDPITSATANTADNAEYNGSTAEARIYVTDYTEIKAVVLKDGKYYSNVVTHTYEVVHDRPSTPVTTVKPGYYTHELGGGIIETLFEEVPEGTEIYYTVSTDSAYVPNPDPNEVGNGITKLYDKTPIEIKGNTVIKAVAVNIIDGMTVKSNVGVYPYTVIPDTPTAMASGEVDRYALIPVDALSGNGCYVEYEINGYTGRFENKDNERFYIDISTGNAYRTADTNETPLCALDLEITTPVNLKVKTVLDGVESLENNYVYVIDSQANPLAPYADKQSGTYIESNTDFTVNLYSIYGKGSGIEIQWKYDGETEWSDYTQPITFATTDTVINVRTVNSETNKISPAMSYVYYFVPPAPTISLPSGVYVKKDNLNTVIAFPSDLMNGGRYRIYFQISDLGHADWATDIDIPLEETTSVKAFIKNENTNRMSEVVSAYYILNDMRVSDGSVRILSPYNVDRISAHLLSTGLYAEGIKLARTGTGVIKYQYRYKLVDSENWTVWTDILTYDEINPVIPTVRMDEIEIIAWIDGNKDATKIERIIDFIHLGEPTVRLDKPADTSGNYPTNTNYWVQNEHKDEENIVVFYTTNGNDPTTDRTKYFNAYAEGEKETLSQTTTVKAVYFYACGGCEACLAKEYHNCALANDSRLYGNVVEYIYPVKTTVTVGGGGGGGGGGGTKVVDNTRKYTKDIFGNEHPTHIGYINGYPDGSVKPEGDITREEITSILYRITNHQYEKPFVATGKVFPDVEVSRWSAHDIEYMADKEIVYGYPDGEFKPSRNLSRAEFAALIFRFTGIEKANIENPFSDFDDTHWAYDEILSLTNSGLIEGYPDKTYKPENNITRAEVMTVINKLLGRKPLESYVKSLEFNPYNDLYEDTWYYVTVLEATITHNYWLNDTGYEYKWEDWK